MQPCLTATSEASAFDGNYVRKLYSGDPETRAHFYSHFGERLELKLRCRLRSWTGVAELRDQTLKRVLEVLCEKPDRLAQVSIASLVNSVCNEVLLRIAP